MEDQQQLAELGAQLQALQVDGADQYRELMVAVGKCAQVLKENTTKHNELLSKYTRLQKNYETLKAGQGSREGGEIVPAGQSYVIVLVDAHSHKFKDRLVGDRRSGGHRAAQLLLESVEECVSKLLPEAIDCRIEVQAFVNLKSLSADAHQRNLADYQPRSLAPFTSSFSRTYGFDFIDVQDETVVQNKIKRRLKECVLEPSCKHVFFAAAGSPLYVQALKETAEHKGAVTLIRGTVPDQELLTLGLPVVSFPSIFQTAQMHHGVPAFGKFRPVNLQKGNYSPAYGIFERTDIDANMEFLETLGDDSKNASSLPMVGQPGLIPVNIQNERLDVYMRPPTKEQRAVYDASIVTKKPCYYHHLRRSCEKQICQFDHTPLEPDALYCIHYFAKQSPCGTGAQCRQLDCLKGHICQKNGCGGGPDECNFNQQTHKMDKKVFKWIDPRVEHTGVPGNTVYGGNDALIDLSG